MSVKIEMYNAYFGDCFFISNAGSKLLVDFGIHRQSNVCASHYIDRDNLLKLIADDLVGRYECASVLITHFHDDHINGLMRMYNLSDTRYKNFFMKIYIPDVWGNKFSLVSTIFEEMILRLQLKNAKIPYSKSSLFDLITFFGMNEKKVVLLSKGVQFEEGKYLALWPPKEVNGDDSIEKLRELRLPNEYIKRLSKLSEKICIYMGGVFDGSVVFAEREIETFHGEYEQIANDYENEVGRIVAADKLNELEHSINVVFHNKTDSNENLLFTGDVEKAHMKLIAGDTEYPLHKRYKYIKIPHHGTSSHYYDYSVYDPEQIMIPNGAVGIASSEIDSNYGILTSRHMCSNSNHCMSCQSSKSCSNTTCQGNVRDIVFPALLKVII